MEAQVETSAEENKRLRRCVSDLVSILALPAVWIGSDPSQIFNTLLDALLSMLELDFVYVRLTSPLGKVSLEMMRSAPSSGLAGEADELGARLKDLFGRESKYWPRFARNRIEDEDISMVPLPIGLQGEIGVIVAGSKRADFPGQTEALVLNVAANQAAIGLQEARLLSEQRHLATELDRRVEQRTKELAESNDKLRLQVGFLQHIPVAAWTLKPDGIPDFVNQTWLDYTGLTLEFVQSDSEAWMEMIHPEDREQTSRVFWDGIHSGQSFTMEARFRRAQDGQYRWHLNRAVPVIGIEGNPVRFVGTSTDIGDLKQFEENSRRAEERTHLIVDSALDTVVTMDAEGIIGSWNKQAEIVFGWSPAEAIGQRMSDLIIPEELRQAHERGLRHFLATGEGPILRRRIEITAIRRGGVEFPVELQVMPLKQGQEWFFSAFIRDITASRLAKQRLEQSEFNLRQMTETIPEMLWSATPDGLIDYCNTRVLDYSGFRAEEIMGENWKKLLHPDDVSQAVQSWILSLATGQPYRTEVRMLHVADGMYRWCITSALPLLDTRGLILKWFGTIVDMHDWKQSQEDLRKMQAELAHVTRILTMGQLTASIAHEVNQPLAGILTNAGTCLRMLDSEPPNIDGARETARRTIRDGNRASDVITKLRDLFRRKDVIAEFLDLNEIAREVIAIMLSDLQSNKVSTRQEFDENLPTIKGDRIQIQQVILNLVRNASDAMRDVDDRTRQILVKTESLDDTSIRFTVRDTGIGFAPNASDRLFDSFYTTKDDGMGIGLSICRSIIEAHSGRLWASANEGPGSSFAFSIPHDHTVGPA
jgi:PAS domain S-box-containing protein